MKKIYYERTYIKGKIKNTNGAIRPLHTQKLILW